jgi:transforming growth factor-beta-induced protein
MKTIKRFSIGLFVITLFTSLNMISSVKANNVGEGTPALTVVEIAIADERFSILVEAVSKAGLVEALSAEGPFTVFAPTNDAFEMLFKDLGVNGVEDLSAEQLTPILLYHVVSGKVMAADVKSGKVSTLNKDAWMNIEAGSKGVTIDEASNVIITDVEGTNGVIHVIDRVLIPETKTAKSSSGCN